jgi:tetratricopeptide (TPR) repeat protein
MRNVSKLAVILLALTTAGCSLLPRIVILRDPLPPAEHLQLAGAYAAEKKWTLAIAQYREVLKKEPENIPALFGLAQAEYRSGEKKRAEKTLIHILDIDPINSMAANNLAWLYAESGTNLDKAERFALRAVENDADHAAGSYDTLARVYLAMGDYDRALQSVQMGLRSASARSDAEGELSRALIETRAVIEAAIESETRASVSTEHRLPRDVQP